MGQDLSDPKRDPIVSNEPWGDALCCYERVVGQMRIWLVFCHDREQLLAWIAAINHNVEARPFGAPKVSIQLSRGGLSDSNAR